MDVRILHSLYSGLPLERLREAMFNTVCLGFAMLLVGSCHLCAQVATVSAKEAYFESQENYVFRDGRLSRGDVEYVGLSELRRRWEHRFEAAEGLEKERWALLLAQVAISKGRDEPDLDAARRWLERAGDGRLALSMRAVVASVADLPGEADSHLRAIQGIGGELDLAVTHQRLEVLRHRMGAAFSTEREFRFWMDAWENARSLRDDNAAMELLPSILRAAERARMRSEWVFLLEQEFREKGGEAWLDAIALARTYMVGLESDRAHEWIERARVLPDTDPLLLKEMVLLLRQSAESFAEWRRSSVFAERALVKPLKKLEQEVPDGLPLLNYIARTTAPAFEGWIVEEQPELSEEVNRKAAELVEANRDRLLREREVWNELRYFRDRPYIKAGREILRVHAETHRDDIYARYFWIQLRLGEDAKVEIDPSEICALLDDAIPRSHEPIVIDRIRTVNRENWLFPLRFPGQIDKNVAFERDRSVFDVSGYDELRRRNTDASYSGHVGAIIVRDLLRILSEKDQQSAARYFDQWVEQATPPSTIQLLTAQIIKSPREVEMMRESEASIVTLSVEQLIDLVFGKRPSLSPKVAIRIGHLLKAQRPDLSAPVIGRIGYDLLHQQAFTEAAMALEEMRKLARSDNREDQIFVWGFSRNLASKSGEAKHEIPQPEILNTMKPIDVAGRLTGYFERRVQGSESNSYFRLSPVYQFLRGIYAPGNEGYDVMFSWGHHPVHVALAIYEVEFANLQMYGDYRTLTREQYAKLGRALGESNRAFRLVRAFYDFDGTPDPQEQIRRVRQIADQHLEDDTLQLVLAVAALTIGDHELALEAAERVKVDFGENAWLANAVKLTCARPLKRDDVAKTAARNLIPLTATPKGRQWLAKELRKMGMKSEAQRVLASRAYADKLVPE